MPNKLLSSENDDFLWLCDSVYTASLFPANCYELDIISYLNLVLQYLITHFSEFQLATVGTFIIHESVFFFSGLPSLYFERSGLFSKYKIQVCLDELLKVVLFVFFFFRWQAFPCTKFWPSSLYIKRNVCFVCRKRAILLLHKIDVFCS